MPLLSASIQVASKSWRLKRGRTNVVVWFAVLLIASVVSSPLVQSHDDALDEVVLVKVGGSSITKKNQRETLDDAQVQWFAETIASLIAPDFAAPPLSLLPNDNKDNIECEATKATTTRRAFVIIHGAGSFGHFHAKEFGLSSKKVPHNSSNDDMETSTVESRRLQMQGLAKTRLSVQTLNRILLESLIHHGVNAIGISPCFAAPSMRADGSSKTAIAQVQSVVEAALLAGLVPVLHGDACLYGTQSAGILSGDTLFEILGLAPWTSRGVFLTDVKGVYTADPRIHRNATLLPFIGVQHGETGNVIVLEHEQHNATINASESLHPQDVTGGFKTKLSAALQVAAAGTNVTIAQCGSQSGIHALQGLSDDALTVIYRMT